MEKYLENEGQDITEDELRAAIRKGTIALKVFPVLCGSAKQHRACSRCSTRWSTTCPRRIDVPPMHALDKTGKDVVCETKDDAPFAALAFKIMNDSFGTLTFIRVYSGRLESGTAVWNTAKKKRERVGRLVQMRADKRDEIEECLAGDICAIVGLKLATTGDTLCVESHQVLLEKIEFPEPVIQLALEPRSTEDADKLVLALQKLSVEDPSFRVRTDEETGQTIIAGMGELHLEIIVDRLKREHKVEARVGKPQVAYRETDHQGRAEFEQRYERVLGGKNQFAHLKLRVSPLEKGQGYQFKNLASVEQIPKDFWPAIEGGVSSGLGRGVVASYPIIDVKVEVVGGRVQRSRTPTRSPSRSPPPWPSTRPARPPAPVLLEPMMKVEIIVPADEHGQRHRRRERPPGQHQGHDPARHQPGDRRRQSPWRRCSATSIRCAASPRPRQLHHAVRKLRADPRQRAATAPVAAAGLLKAPLISGAWRSFRKSTGSA